MMLIIEERTDKVLLIRHAYGRRDLWTIPGGGYWPSREEPKDAAIREVWEEVGADVRDVQELGQIQGSSISKHSTKHIFKGTLISQTPVSCAEIEEQRWVAWDDAVTLGLSTVAAFAINQYGAARGN